jgi:hypothetical protein
MKTILATSGAEPPLTELFGPGIAAGSVHHVRILGMVADRLAQYPCDDAFSRSISLRASEPPMQLPKKKNWRMPR